MCRFVLTFALGAGPVPSLLLPEIFPSRIRAKAMAICMSVHWVIFFLFTFIFIIGCLLSLLPNTNLYTCDCHSFHDQMQTEHYRDLLMVFLTLSGNQFLRWLALPAFARETWTATLILNVCKRLYDGCCLC